MFLQQEKFIQQGNDWIKTWIDDKWLCKILTCLLLKNYVNINLDIYRTMVAYILCAYCLLFGELYTYQYKHEELEQFQKGLVNDLRTGGLLQWIKKTEQKHD